MLKSIKNNDEIRKCFNCSFCQGLLLDPIILPCAEIICCVHIENFLIDSKTIRCVFCKKKHIYPKQGFPEDIRIKKLLDLQVHELNLNIKKKKSSVSKSKKLSNNTKDKDNDLFIYFDQIKHKVDQKRKNFKTQIDNYSNEIIQNINKFEIECKKSLKKIDHLGNDMIDIRNQLNILINELDTFELRNDKIENIMERADKMKTTFFSKLNECKKILIDKNSDKFHQNTLQIENLFISLNTFENKYFIGSSILKSFKEERKLLKLCEFTNDASFRLIYKASNDGFCSKNFHAKTDKFNKTLILIKTTKNYVFGGYTEQKWSGRDIVKCDENAFLFSLYNKENMPIKIKCSTPKNAINCDPTWGPVFGYNCTDLAIVNESNLTNNSFSYLGHNYSHPVYEKGSLEAETFLAGERFFQTVEIEIFCKE